MSNGTTKQQPAIRPSAQSSIGVLAFAHARVHCHCAICSPWTLRVLHEGCMHKYRQTSSHAALMDLVLSAGSDDDDDVSEMSAEP